MWILKFGTSVIFVPDFNFLMKSIFVLPDEVLLQLYKRVSKYIFAVFFLLSIVTSYLCNNKVDGFICAILLFVLIQGGVWLSLKTKINLNIVTLPIAMLLMFFIDLYSNKEAPFYIFALILFVYINLFIPNKIVRLVYLILMQLDVIQMVYADMIPQDILRIVVSYFVAAFSMYLLVDYLRKVERDLAFRNQDLTDIFNCSPLPIMLLDLQGNIIMINESFLEMIGFTEIELKGKTLREVYYFESAKRASDLLRYFKAASDDNKTLHVEDEYKKRNGEVITFSADIKPLELHNDKYILFVGQDVTRELKLRKEIQRTHKLYRTMAANMPNSTVFMFDRQLRFMLVEGDDLNKAGSNKSKMVGKTLREAFETESANILEQYFKASLLGVESTIEIEQNGKHYVYYFLPVRAENNEIMSGIALSVNITELKQTKTEVGIKNSMIDAYAHKASHVVRRPIANLLGLADILMNTENTEEEKQTVIQFIYDSIKELDENLKEAAVELNK